MDKYNIRTDLALEARELCGEKAENIDGVEAEYLGDNDVPVTRVKITNENGAKALGKEMGTYITVEAPLLRENRPDIMEKASFALQNELKELLGDRGKKSVLAVGLGNRMITPDSLGPKVISHLVVTRHIMDEMPRDAREEFAPLCAVAPGVLGITGIETGEIIKGVAERVKPDMIIAVDSLAARKTERVSTTVQISDTGISPGSGVGNTRNEISEKTLGIPVIAIGVPMVVDAATIANDAIDSVIDVLAANSDKDGGFYKMLKNMDRQDKHTLISGVLSDRPFYVTPKEIDAVSDRMAKVVANGINKAVHSGITDEEINAFTS